MKEALNKFKSLKLVQLMGFNRVVLIGVIILMYLLFSILSPILHHGTNFMQISRILSALNYGYFIGFLALGVTFVIATGGIDFSIGPVMFCAALISGYCLNQYGFPLWLCLMMCVAIGAVFGTVGGAFVAYLHLPSFITSMALMPRWPRASVPCSPRRRPYRGRRATARTRGSAIWCAIRAFRPD